MKVIVTEIKHYQLNLPLIGARNDSYSETSQENVHEEIFFSVKLRCLLS